MLDIKFIRENPDVVKDAVAKKGIDLDVDRLLALHEESLAILRQVEQMQAANNSLSRSMGTRKLAADEKQKIAGQVKASKAEITKLTESRQPLEAELKELMYKTPTIPSSEAPIGESDKDNVVVKTVGDLPVFSFAPRNQTELLKLNDWAEFETVSDICGPRSYALKNELVAYEMALQSFVASFLANKGFTLITVPSHVKKEALYNMGQLPNDPESVYELPKDDLYLAGTAEVVLNSLNAGKILQEDQLPLMYAGISPCFRREAGSAGRDVRGLIRVHQFNKIEQYVISLNSPEASAEMHDFLLANSLEILAALELPYRIVECCTGDMGMGKFRMHDIEVWCPSEQKYRETHSCSSLHEWQARRTNIRYRDSSGEVRFVHTLNNTGIATPRIFVPLLENHQREDGSVYIPKALQPFMGGRDFIGGAKPAVPTARRRLQLGAKRDI